MQPQFVWLADRPVVVLERHENGGALAIAAGVERKLTAAEVEQLQPGPPPAAPPAPAKRPRVKRDPLALAMNAIGDDDGNGFLRRYARPEFQHRLAQELMVDLEARGILPETLKAKLQSVIDTKPKAKRQPRKPGESRPSQEELRRRKLELQRERRQQQREQREQQREQEALAEQRRQERQAARVQRRIAAEQLRRNQRAMAAWQASTITAALVSPEVPPTAAAVASVHKERRLQRRREVDRARTQRWRERQQQYAAARIEVELQRLRLVQQSPPSNGTGPHHDSSAGATAGETASGAERQPLSQRQRDRDRCSRQLLQTAGQPVAV